MPFAVAHMLIPMLFLDILRDNILKIKKSNLPNRYILIGGIFGLLPDIDVPLSLLVFRNLQAHRILTHSIWIPLIILLLSLAFYLVKKREWFLISLICFVGISSHIFLDAVTSNSVALFYPLNENFFGINLMSPFATIVFYAVLDAVLLCLWFVRMFFRKRIQDIL